jgi:hypothetical protein
MKGFIPLTEKYPNPEQVILIKIKPNQYGDISYYVDVPYYVVRYTNDTIRTEFRFEEASGEQYAYWYDDEILGWMPLEELNTIPICGKEE